MKPVRTFDLIKNIIAQRYRSFALCILIFAFSSTAPIPNFFKTPPEISHFLKNSPSFLNPHCY